ncbi:MAG: sugar phosphate isomerase/epimerase [Clostridia bacterium]|nr:sugar phosphate isomerase/epimerase [Clostridia bacterium]
MNIGIRLHDTAPGTLRERLSFSQAQGFTCAHLALSKTVQGFDMQNAPALLTDALADEVKGMFSDHHMQCAVLGCYLNLADPDAEARQRTQEIYKAHLRFAPRMDALTVGTETPANKNAVYAEPASRSEEAFALFLDSLRPVVRAAEEAGAILAVEPVSHHIVSTPERAQRMLEAIPSDNLRIILDAVNLLSPNTVDQADAIVEDALRRLGEKIIMLHMKDYRLQPGKVAACACGTGSMRYERLLAFAKARSLPMTLENTTPENAEAARLYLERAAAKL